MCIQNVPVYAGTTRTCVSTCARGAGTHGDVLNLHTEGVLYIHTEGAGGHRQFCSPKFAHVWLSRDSEVHQRNQWIFTIFSLRIGREQHVADSSKLSLCLIKLFNSGSTEGHCGATGGFDLSFATKTQVSRNAHAHAHAHAPVHVHVCV